MIQVATCCIPLKQIKAPPPGKRQILYYIKQRSILTLLGNLMKKMHLLLSTAVLSIISISAADAASGIYFDANLGLAQHKWQDGYGPGPSPDDLYNWKNGNQGFSWGVDAGYQFSQNFAVELGYFKLPTAKFRYRYDRNTKLADSSIKSNLIYAALSSKIDISQQYSLLLKAGFSKQQISGSEAFNERWGYRTSTNVKPLFGIGLNYAMSNGLKISAQYLYAAGKTSNIDLDIGPTTFVPPVNLFTLGIGYSFSV